MGIPVSLAAELFKAVSRHGVKYVGFDEMNAVIAALSPCFEPGYLDGMNGWPLKHDEDRELPDDTG
jgi:hypothetical protein